MSLFSEEVQVEELKDYISEPQQIGEEPGSPLSPMFTPRKKGNGVYRRRLVKKDTPMTLNTECISDTENTSFLEQIEESSCMVVLEVKSVSQKQGERILFARVEKAEEKLSTHFSLMMKCDKYIRLLTSLIKTYRAFVPQNRFVKMYKEMILARRVIRWQGKYNTVFDLIKGKDGVGMKMLKAFQIVGDLVDWAAFWLGTVKKGQELVGKLEQIQSNFYFVECIVWLGIFSLRYLKQRLIQTSSSPTEQSKRNQTENGWKVVKYILDVLSSYNNSSMKKKMGEINPKLTGLFTILSSCIGLLLMWR